jgi:hypothetical protein
MFLAQFINVAPALVLWVTVIVLAAILLRRGGDRAERFLILGASLKIVSNLLGLAAFGILHGLINRGYSITYANSVVFGYGIFCNIVDMAGIVCLVYAFWVKFKVRKLESRVLREHLH